MEVYENIEEKVVLIVNIIIMAKGYSYVVARDFGFAPNPFNGFLTLATCKPKIRKWAQVGDFVIGNANKQLNNKLIYMMKVTKKITFDDYWQGAEYLCKRPVMNGSVKTMYGDNIYHHDESGKWVQEDSHHSLPKGKLNIYNLNRDTGETDAVLISTEFFYFGRNMVDVPLKFRRCLHRYIGQKKVSYEDCLALWKYLEDNYPKNELIALPRQFNTFKRYDGKS